MTSLRPSFIIALGTVAALAASQPAFSQVTVYSASGDKTTVDPIVTNFRTAIQNTPDGEQRIAWDGVPDGFAVPLASTAFQGRGVLLTNPNSGTVQVSLNDPDPSNPGPLAQFGDVNPGYPQIFQPFSGDQLFTAIGGNQVQVDFVIPNTTIPALTRGFGVVFSDVDLYGPTTIQLYDASNNLISLDPSQTTVPASTPPGGPENQSFSFLGLLFDNPVIRRAVITNGNFEIAPGFSDGKDLVVMDDYIFSTPVPEPSTWLLVAAGLVGLVWLRRNRLV